MRNRRLSAEWDHLARCYVRLAEQADQNSFADIWFESGSKPSLDGEALRAGYARSGERASAFRQR